MATIIKKNINGKAYYYARECQRVNGKPKIVWQKYLGRADDIVRAMSRESTADVPAPKEVIITEFGAVVSLFDLAKRLRLLEHIDRHAPKPGNGPSVGTYLLVAILNRCIAPCSKAGLADWFQTTSLRRLMGISAKQLSSQRFWDNMNHVSSQTIEAIEQDVTTHMVKEFKINLRQVLFDATNFFTYIDTFNERCSLAQRGKSKQERKSLRIVGLALLVSSDFHVPLLHRTYPGNQTDAPTFSSLTSELVARCRQVSEETEHITLIFDKGNNSSDNLDAVEASPYHFIGSLVPTQHPDLLQAPSEQFHSLAADGLQGVCAFRTTKKIFGVQRTVLITYNENLFIAQSRTLLREIAKRQQYLRELQGKLDARREKKTRGGKAPTMAGVKKKVDGWLKARHMKELFHTEITEQNGVPMLEYRFEKDAWESLQKTLLGKTILFTDNDDWTDARIVHGYRSQHHVESAFRCMKDPHHISLRPQFHWTDQKIEVHVFCCVLALMLCSLLQRELHHKGISLSVPEALDRLAGIREVGIVYPSQVDGKKPTIKMTLSSISEEQRALFEALDLKRYLAI